MKKADVADVGPHGTYDVDFLNDVSITCASESLPPSQSHLPRHQTLTNIRDQK